MPDNNNKTLITLVVLAVIAVALYGVLTMPDQRTTGERIGDAIDATREEGLSEGIRQMERRTPGERLGDAVEDAGEDIKRNTGDE